MTTPTLPVGFNPVPAGRFIAGQRIGEEMAAFDMKANPVTNAEYGAVAKSLGPDRYVLLRHDSKTGETILEKTGATVKSLGLTVDKKINFDKGEILVLGAAILVKMVDNPSAHYDEPEEKFIFGGADQPAVSITYFHAKAWCLLKTRESQGKLKYDLPTDLQYEYVASDRGTKQYGTETGALTGQDGRALAHIDSNDEPTVSVFDSRYTQKLPFGIQTTGNVWRLIRFNPQINAVNKLEGYSKRGGSWLSSGLVAMATFREQNSSKTPRADTGFSPVIVRSNSK